MCTMRDGLAAAKAAELRINLNVTVTQPQDACTCTAAQAGPTHSGTLEALSCCCLLLLYLIQSCARVCVCVTAVPVTNLFKWWFTCATRDKEPTPVWTSLAHHALVNAGGKEDVEDMC